MARWAMAGSILAGWWPEISMYRPARWVRAVCWAVGHTDSGRSAGIGGLRGALGDVGGDVLVGDEMGGLAALSGVADLGGLPVGGAAGEVAVADRRVQGDDVAEVGEPGGSGERDGEAGEVLGAALAPGVLGDHDEPAAGAEHLVAGGVDLGHGFGVGGAAGVAEIGPVGRVVEGVGRAQPAAGQPGLLVDHPGVARVRR